MFHSRYPPTRLTHVRVLRSHGTERGLHIIPKPFPPTPPPEIKHHHSCVIPLPVAGKAMVIEWTGGEADMHLVDL